MRKVRYAVAMSLDGFIAGPHGDADWIEMDPTVDIAAFFRMDTYVFSRTLPSGPRDGVTIVGENGVERLKELRAGTGKDIWLFGGGSLFGSLASAGLVDVAELSVMPVMLGDGQRVMSDNTTRVTLHLGSCVHSGTGVLSLTYAVGRPER